MTADMALDMDEYWDWNRMIPEHLWVAALTIVVFQVMKYRWGNEWAVWNLSTCHAVVAVLLGYVSYDAENPLSSSYTFRIKNDWILADRDLMRFTMRDLFWHFKSYYTTFASMYFIIDFFELLMEKVGPRWEPIFNKEKKPVMMASSWSRLIFGLHHTAALILFYHQSQHWTCSPLVTCLLVSELPVWAVKFNDWQRMTRRDNWPMIRVLTQFLMLAGFLYFRLYRYRIVYEQESRSPMCIMSGSIDHDPDMGWDSRFYRNFRGVRCPEIDPDHFQNLHVCFLLLFAVQFVFVYAIARSFATSVRRLVQ